MRMGPDVIRADLSTTQTRLRAGGGGYKVRKWCSFGGGVWEVWRMGSVGWKCTGECASWSTGGAFFRVWELRGRCLLGGTVVTDAIAGEGLLF